ncbi:MAG: UDP-N-acetyl-D-mannosamine dehydrogenase, partial [Primorskyibacter sp.]
RADHSPDLSYIHAAAQTIAPVLAPGALVVLESTSPVGSTRKLAHWLAHARPDLSFPQDAGEAADIQIAYCPERVLPGHVMRELVENDRVIGGMSQTATRTAIALYGKAVRGECIPTTAETAEMCKLVENSSRDVQIAFANELSMICEKFDVNVWDLIALANRHPRVNILQPGAGVGGHCIAVDPWFIIDSAPAEARLIRMAREVNESKPQWVLDKAKAAITDFLSQHPDRSLSSVRLACLGLAFKPNIDDLRESPALGIACDLAHLGCEMLVVEPHIDALPEGLAQGAVRLVDLDPAQQQADVICVLVKHSVFAGVRDHLSAEQILVDVVGL